MARTLQTIYNQIITEKQSYANLNTLTPINDSYQALLSNLTSQSKVAVWRLWVYLIAFGIWFHEQIFDAHTAEVEEMIADNQLGQLRWYVVKAKEFQYGYDLTWDGDDYVYLDVDEDAKIIAQASAVEGGSAVLIKVAKYVTPSTPEDSELTPLLTAEESAFDAYLTTIKPAGLQAQTINLDPDDMIVELNIMYNPLILTALGELIEDSTVTELEAGDKPAKFAFETFVKSLPFDSKFRIIEMVDAIQAAEGINNIVVVSCEARSGTNPYTDITAEYDQQYTTNSGYFRPSDSITSTFNYYEYS